MATALTLAVVGFFAVAFALSGLLRRPGGGDDRLVSEKDLADQFPPELRRFLAVHLSRGVPSYRGLRASATNWVILAIGGLLLLVGLLGAALAATQ